VNDTEIQFAFIHAYAKEYPITKLVEITNVSRSGYYKWKNRGAENWKDIIDEKLIPYITKIFNDHRGTYGRKRIKQALEEEFDLVINEKRVARIMRKYGLVCKIRRKRFRHQHQPFGDVPNILDQNFKAIKPNMKLAIDISYLEVKKGIHKWVYLCAIKDLYNNEIVAYSMGTCMDTNLVYRALNELKKRKLENGAILHSDQGVQFTNFGYKQKIGAMGLTQSMSRRGNCWDNACIENFFGQLKVEAPHWSVPETVLEVYQSVHDYIYYYNNKRIITKLKTNPVKYRETAA